MKGGVPEDAKLEQIPDELWDKLMGLAGWLPRMGWVAALLIFLRNWRLYREGSPQALGDLLLNGYFLALLAYNGRSGLQVARWQEARYLLARRELRELAESIKDAEAREGGTPAQLIERATLALQEHASASPQPPRNEGEAEQLRLALGYLRAVSERRGRQYAEQVSFTDRHLRRLVKEWRTRGML